MTPDEELSRMGNSQFWRLLVVLSAWLVSCGTPRYTIPTMTGELDPPVLVLAKAPDGRMRHSWRRVEDFDLGRYKYRSIDEGRVGHIVLAASRQTDCYAQHLECYQQCRQIPIPPDFNQSIHDFGPRAGHDRYCSEKCMPRYAECLKAQGTRIQAFTTADEAVDWLKRNQKSVVVGSLVFIAGAVFITVSAGAGVVILIPLVALTSSEVTGAAHTVAASP